MNKILIIGQTPPPIGGQALMIKYMLENKYDNTELFHVRMNFSRDFNQRGKFSFYKVLHLISIIYQTYIIKFKYNIDTLYYPLSSSPKVAVFRDAIILFFIKKLFKRTIYHFHAAGISEELPKYNKIIKNIIYNIINKPSIAITSSEFNPNDSEYLQAKRKFIIPLGLPDQNNIIKPKYFFEDNIIKIIFIGLLNRSKGELDVLEAVKILMEKGYKIQYSIAGRFESEMYKIEFFDFVKKWKLDDCVTYKSVIVGEEKKKIFLDADLICFPSYFPSESFGLVLIEAMMFQLPIIASNWRGLKSLVTDNENGFLVDIRSPDQIANNIEILFNDKDLVTNFSTNSRVKYETYYTLDKYIERLNYIFNLN